MGGRSRRSREERVGNFGFLENLSDERLDHYGKYSSMAYQNLDAGTITRNGVPMNHEGLNEAAAQEYHNRFGQYPEWRFKFNYQAEYNHYKAAGFKMEGD